MNLKRRRFTRKDFRRLLNKTFSLQIVSKQIFIGATIARSYFLQRDIFTFTFNDVIDAWEMTAVIAIRPIYA